MKKKINLAIVFLVLVSISLLLVIHLPWDQEPMKWYNELRGSVAFGLPAVTWVLYCFKIAHDIVFDHKGKEE